MGFDAGHALNGIHYGFTCLCTERRGGAPVGPGILPPVDEAERARCRAMRAELDEIIARPVQRHMDRRLAELGVGPLPMPVLDAAEALPDVHRQPTVPSFEYPLAHVPPALAFVVLGFTACRRRSSCISAKRSTRLLPRT